jgi:hypothetical protein
MQINPLYSLTVVQRIVSCKRSCNRLSNRSSNRLQRVHASRSRLQRVNVHPTGCTTGWTTGCIVYHAPYNRLSNQLYNRLYQRLHRVKEPLCPSAYHSYTPLTVTIIYIVILPWWMLDQVQRVVHCHEEILVG